MNYIVNMLLLIVTNIIFFNLLNKPGFPGIPLSPLSPGKPSGPGNPVRPYVQII